MCVSTSACYSTSLHNSFLSTAKPGFPSCRIHITLHGLEWFVYNRIASYENIITSLGSSLSHAAASNQHQHTDGRGTLSRSLFGSGPVPGCEFSVLNSVTAYTNGLI